MLAMWQVLNIHICMYDIEKPQAAYLYVFATNKEKKIRKGIKF